MRKTGIEALKSMQRRILNGSMCDIFSNINAKYSTDHMYTKQSLTNVWEFTYCNQFKTTMFIHLYAFSQ